MGPNSNPHFEKLVENQTRMIETLMKEIRELKDQKADEDQIAVSKQIEKLEKMLEKKDQRAEQEEFQYQLKRDMAEYVRGLGEILAGQREEIKGPEDEIDAIMGKAEDKLAFMNRLAKQQAKLNKKKLAEQSDDDEDEYSTSQASSRRSKAKTKTAQGGDMDNVPNPDQLMQMLMAQNQMGGNGPMMMPGAFPGGFGAMQPPGFTRPAPAGSNRQMGSQNQLGSKRSMRK